jgi:ABC-type phosphate/phosphonate transport system substrate-binding protein
MSVDAMNEDGKPSMDAGAAPERGAKPGRFVMNARMYAVTPEVEEAWRGLLAHVTAEAGIGLDYLPYPAPQPLEVLWARPDLGCVFMCGYPIALKLADVTPLAAPIPAADWAEGRAVYRSDLIVRKDAPYRTLEDTFGGRAGWTVEHSHSGFNAFRHHLLRYRSPDRSKLYRETVGPLVTARKILDSVVDGTIDVGPLDAYWHMLIAKHRPDLTSEIRVLESTDVAPMPAFVAAPGLGEEAVGRLRDAFVGAARRPWFAPYAAMLLLEGFSSATSSHFATTLAWDEDAKAAGYPAPA